MEIRVLGCHGSQSAGYGLTGFLIDAKVLLDAGTATSVLTMEEQARIDHVLITHAHMDHICELASLADNLCGFDRGYPLTIVSVPGVIETLRSHIFNGIIWPDFAVLPSGENPVLRYVAIRPGEMLKIGHLGVRVVPVHHTVETVAYVVETLGGDGRLAAIFAGDTGPTEEIWRVAGRENGVRAIFVETSLPDERSDLAERSGHLTPARLIGELDKIGPYDHGIYLYHMKVPYHEMIRSEIERRGIPNLHFLRDGQVIRI